MTTRTKVALMGFTWAALILAGVVASCAQAQTQAWDTNILTWPDGGNCGTYCPTQGFELQGASSSTATTWTAIASLASTARQYVHNNTGSGQHCYRLILIGTGMRSAEANTVCKSNVQPIPPTASALQVADANAYKLNIGNNDQVKVAQIGKVRLGTRCIDDTVNGMNVVAVGKRTSVDGKLTSPLITDALGKPVAVPKQVLAKCERKA